ncbi:adenylyl-sulfate kinase [Salidesulfovibrio brasiliensis]|uniref:adenylyl-sulfate kinase n=1 Tax=Salidesulfovibrio brasiliensis TaxID=221711 RepID=UPI0006D04AC7|nr:adenylyl-sulfate kinase [Salidesulfovibrio brasiliensis]
MKKYIQPHRGDVDRGHREESNGHKGGVFWFTGLSGSGKSTIAHAVEKKLFDLGKRVYVFDGDNVRHGLCGDLSFSPEARAENIRRIAEVTRLFVDNGIICMCAFISPMRADRERVKDIVGESDFHEVYISCPVSVCEERDVKGYYKLAREGKIKNYTGISAPYEEPTRPNIAIHSDRQDVDESVQLLFEYILKQTKL